MSAPITRASISSVTPGIVADPHAGLARRLAGGGVGERLQGRGDHDVGGEHRRGDRRGRLGGVRVALGDHRQRRVRSLALGDDPDQRTELLGDRIADDEDFLVGRHSEAIPAPPPQPPCPEPEPRVEGYCFRPRRSSSAG